MTNLKWFNTENCEYPDLKESKESTHVWVFHKGKVEHVFYSKTVDGKGFFVDFGGIIINGVVQWAVFVEPSTPNNTINSQDVNKINIEIDLGNDGYKLIANLYEDGDQWCVSIGEMPTGLFGFSTTIGGAVAEFKDNCRNPGRK